MSGVESAGDGDVRERLLPARARRASQEDEEEREDSFTHEELLHSIGSFSAVVWPVAVTMLLARCPRAPFEILEQHSSFTYTIIAAIAFFTAALCLSTWWIRRRPRHSRSRFRKLQSYG
jgi:hypothetical protein